MKGLIIAEPWVGYILDGSKTWEMRSKPTKVSGRIALIRKGSGAVCGVANLVGVEFPLTQAEMLATTDKHRIPAEMIHSGEVAKWCVPWVLSEVRVLAGPVPYKHPSGAVIWVDLNKEVVAQVNAQLNGGQSEPAVAATHHEIKFNAAKYPGPQPVTAHRHGAEVPQSPVGTGELIGSVELTSGNIRNNHIYLRGFFDKFPADVVGGSNRSEAAERELIVTWGEGNRVPSDLDKTKKIFRSRSWIRQFFEHSGATPGDVVQVYRLDPYTYHVRLARDGEGIQRVTSSTMTRSDPVPMAQALDATPPNGSFTERITSFFRGLLR
ncbi:ASCH domain-containing protein [Nitratireductor aquibiodomus]|uniref:ASCH domain-containing protein n=1 Tax=Nitratireductor aquibiodomus TaxID=204799 RepID=UPI0019D36097|nr:ASCH domain-containing protein [Nitratireductor aquibiodomus]MBN7764080.1 ASCH domain-containing protein [Nitratireductor aquibiodomus]